MKVRQWAKSKERRSLQ